MFSLSGVVNSISNFSSTNNISYFWNSSSIGGTYIGVQVLSGLVISMFLVGSTIIAFFSIENLIENTNSSSVSRLVHANICSFVFMIIIFHIGKGIWYNSWMNISLWNSGILLLILTMGSSFLSYVLPWSHISYWGATVITSMVTVLPYGECLLPMVWSSPVLSDATLNRMFSLHFLLPLLVIALIVMHLLVLHEYVSSSNSLSSGVCFTSFLVNDAISIFSLILIVLMLIGGIAVLFLDADNWIEANGCVTPEHIKPEWYFLFAYCILRCIPNKTISVIGLVMSLVIVLILVITSNWMIMFLGVFTLSTWLSGVHVLDWYTWSSQLVTIIYVITLV